MENNFNFKSQACTDRVQSERLLALGLKKETADMCWQTTTLNGEPITYPSQDVWLSGSIITNNHFPAWSLGRLLEICGEDRLPISFHKKGKVKIRVNHIHPTHDGRSGYNYYDSIIDCIEWLIKEGYFNKEYLV